jgi:hypothetical protein
LGTEAGRTVDPSILGTSPSRSFFFDGSTMTITPASLFPIAHVANDAFLKLYPKAVTTVSLVGGQVITIDCGVSGVRIVMLPSDQGADVVTLAVGRTDTGAVEDRVDIAMASLTGADVLRLMEEKFVRYPHTAG